jgi:hypothetical protein
VILQIAAIFCFLLQKVSGSCELLPVINKNKMTGNNSQLPETFWSKKQNIAAI